MTVLDINTFVHTEFGEVRQLWIDGQPWFVLNDVRQVLGYTRTSDALKNLRHSQFNTAERRVGVELGQRGGRLPYLITESGLYRLMLRSEAPNAEHFQIWVEDELLPTVRKAYSLGIDAIGELKERIADLELENELYKISEQGDFERRHRSWMEGFRAGQAHPDLTFTATGRYRPLEQG